MQITTLVTPDGPFVVLTENGFVIAAGWHADADRIRDRLSLDDQPTQEALVATPSDPAVSFATDAVQAYYEGDFDAVNSVPVHHSGTELQRAGWARLRQIRPGEPLSYTGFAASLGRPGAVRAAANVCARNPTALFVPCHRVVRSDGSLGGFAWGLDVKRSLLAREASLR
jgi:methylated-DNA-[protein]-cysteine S-methyltransferase